MPTSACGQRRRVVDAVARHRHDAALGLQPLDDRRPSARAAPRPRPPRSPASGRPPRAVARLSPVSMTTRMPVARSARSASGVEALIGSATPSRPGRLAVHRDEHHGLPLAPQRLGLRRRDRPGSTPSVSRSSAFPSATRRPSDPARHALPRDRLEVRRLARARARARARRRRWRRRADARSPARGSPPGAAARASSCGRRATTAASRGLPSVSVPVLSTTSVSTFSSISSASAFLMSTPAVAPRPVPTMIDIGVASPSAHGHAMISTATALTERVGEPRLGPERAPGDERQDRDGHHGRHEVAGHAVGQALNRRAAALRLADHAGRSARAACRGRPARPASRRRRSR